LHRKYKQERQGIRGDGPKPRLKLMDKISSPATTPFDCNINQNTSVVEKISQIDQSIQEIESMFENGIKNLALELRQNGKNDPNLSGS
jgi:hypothetical protein